MEGMLESNRAMSAGSRPETRETPRHCLHPHWWRGMESHHASLAAADLQSAPAVYRDTAPLARNRMNGIVPCGLPPNPQTRQKGEFSAVIRLAHNRGRSTVAEAGQKKSRRGKSAGGENDPSVSRTGTGDNSRLSASPRWSFRLRGHRQALRREWRNPAQSHSGAPC